MEHGLCVYRKKYCTSSLNCTSVARLFCLLCVQVVDLNFVHVNALKAFRFNRQGRSPGGPVVGLIKLLEGTICKSYPVCDLSI